MALRKIDGNMIAPQAIKTENLADDAVPSAKVADGTIAPADTTSQIATTGKALSVAIALG